jgi:hypothetical protein
MSMGTEGSSQTSWTAIQLLITLRNAWGDCLLQLKTNGISLYGGYFTRYGKAVVQTDVRLKFVFVQNLYLTTRKDVFNDTLSKMHGPHFSGALLLAFVFNCCCEHPLIDRIRDYLLDLPGLGQTARIEQEKSDRRRQKLLNDQQPQQQQVQDSPVQTKCFLM